MLLFFEQIMGDYIQILLQQTGFIHFFMLNQAIILHKQNVNYQHIMNPDNTNRMD